MKKLIMTLILFVAIKSNGQITSSKWTAISTKESIDKKQLLLDSICKERGHVFTPINNYIKSGFTIIGPQTWGGEGRVYAWPVRESDTTTLQLIDTKDSSYLIRNIPSDFKFCYRCLKDIEFRKEKIFVKTVWRRSE